jgi:Leucine-rich repeat (LRR) protein
MLDLAGNQLGDTALAVIGAADLPGLKSLYIGRTDVTDAGLKLLQPLKNLEDLNLTETRIDGSGLPSLAPLPIRTLRLSRTPLDPQSIRSLAEFPRLRALDVSGTRVTDDALPVLDSLRDLSYLNLTWTRVSVEALDRLRRERPGCQIERRTDRVFETWQSLLPGGQPATE